MRGGETAMLRREVREARPDSAKTWQLYLATYTVRHSGRYLGTYADPERGFAV